MQVIIDMCFYKQSTMSNNNSYTDQSKLKSEEKRCTLVGMACDVILSMTKIATGALGHSSAILADGIHSISDTMTDALVYAMVRLSGKGADDRYRYGRGKFETLAAFLISVILVIVALGLLVEGVKDVYAAASGETLERPHKMALIVGIVSVLIKESLYHYTRFKGQHTGSSALMVYAWHHRADALSTIATLMGVAGAICLGERWRVLDPIAAIGVSVVILLLAYRLGRPAVEELLEVSLPDKEKDQITTIVTHTPGVKAFHNLRTRRNGNLHVVDLHIKVDGDLSVARAHDITREIEKQLSNELGEVMTNIHIEPYRGSNMCEKESDEPIAQE